MQSLLEVISENVRFYRKKTGLSQLKMAYQIDIAPSHLAEIERGKQYPSLKIIEKLAAYFKVEPYRLLYPLESDKKDNSVETIQTLRLLKQELTETIDKKIFNLMETNIKN